MADRRCEHVNLAGIPALVWGERTGRAFLHVHGKCSCKEYAADFAAAAEAHGWQTVSFDLPGHGERADIPCDVWHGVADVAAMAEAVRSRWPRMALFACSLGAYFSLRALADKPPEGCLLQSPILDMGWLIERMMAQAGVTEAQLARAGRIDTPIDTLDWDYRQEVLAHPITRWEAPTAILRAERDQLQSLAVTEAFARRFGCRLDVAPGCDHPFMAPGDGAVVRAWLEARLSAMDG